MRNKSGGTTSTDTNGNYVTRSTPFSNETHWTDSDGRLVLKIVDVSSTRREYHVFDAAGMERIYAENLTTINVSSQFSCTGVQDYSATATVVSSFELPTVNGFTPTYTFQYDTKGRVIQVTLPTGGSYTYSYATVECSDGSTKTLTRTVNPGAFAWDYSRSLVGSIWKTTAKAPPLAYDSGVRNETLVEFTNSLETKQTVYQGAVGGTALLTTVSTNTTIGTAQVPNSRTVILPNNLQSKVTFLFDSFTENGLTRTRGNLKEIKEYDYGQGAPPATHARKITLGYLHESQSAYAAKNIVNRVTSIRVDDSGGVKKAETLIEYDQGTLQAVGGAANHDYTGFPTTYTTRGNPTTMQRWVIGTTYVATTQTYDELGNARTVNDPGGHQTNFDYADSWENSACLPTGGSALAFPTTITNPLGHVTTAKYHSCTSQMGRVTDPNNQITTVAYADPLSRPTQTSFPDGGWITLQYADSTRTVTATQKRTDTANVTVIEAYNELGALIQRQLPGNRKVDLTYDPLGRVWKVSNPWVTSGEPTSGEVKTELDALGRVKKMVKQDGTFVQVDYASNATQITDEAGKKRQTVMDALGRVTKVCEVTAGNSRSLAESCGIAGFTGTGYVTTNSYDILDNVTQTSQGSQTRTMSYDGLSRVTAAKIIEVSTTTNVTYGYDADGNRTSVTDPRGAVNFEYDALHRLRKKKHGTTVVAEYTYDGTAANNGIGRLITETDGPVGTADKTDYTYDAMGRVKTANQTISGTPYAMAYTYDFIGSLTELSYPSASGVRRKVQYAYNAAAELDKVSDITSTAFDYVTGASYSPLGTVQQFDLNNLMRTTLDWNKLFQLTSVLTQKQGGSAFLNLGYAYFANGQIQEITNNLDSLKSEKYTYDELYRLLTAQRGPDASIQRKYSYDYDRFGNRWAQTLVVGTGYSGSNSYNYANNRITSANFSYDASGNLTANGPTTSYTYNPENFMTAVGASISYPVDTLGRRTKKTVSGTTTDYFYSGSVVVSEKQGTAWTDYIFFGNQRIAKQTGSTASTATYIHPDHLGSTRLCTDANGNSSGTCDYEPFGEIQPGSPCGIPTNYRFAGMEFDSETGLYHTWFRQYDPSQGRWMSIDLLGPDPSDPQSFDRYLYVLDDPANLFDPLGLCGVNPITGQPGLKGTTVTSRYGPRTSPITGKRQFHRGVDLAAASWTPLYPLLPGTVVGHGVTPAAGLFLTVQVTGTDYYYQYLHLSGAIVSPTEIGEGVTIAWSGETGSVTGPHLHLQIYKIEKGKRKFVKPINFLTEPCPWERENPAPQNPAQGGSGLGGSPRGGGQFVLPWWYRQIGSFTTWARGIQIAVITVTITFWVEKK